MNIDYRGHAHHAVRPEDMKTAENPFMIDAERKKSLRGTQIHLIEAPRSPRLTAKSQQFPSTILTRRNTIPYQ